MRVTTTLLGLALSLTLAVSDAPPPQIGSDTSWSSTIDGALTVTASQTQPASSSGSPSHSQGRTTPRYLRPDQNHQNDVCVGIADERCREAHPQTPPPPAADSGQPLTITDVAQFAPDPTTTATEPADAGVSGLPTNFLTPTTPTTRTGSLFDTPVSVRFTPVRYDFTFGDGSTLTSTAPGLPWSALHQEPFTPTPTSHTYAERGTYITATTTTYTAELDSGDGWIPLSGELPIPGPTRTIRIYKATTALVQHTCIEQPTAPGC